MKDLKTRVQEVEDELHGREPEPSSVGKVKSLCSTTVC